MVDLRTFSGSLIPGTYLAKNVSWHVFSPILPPFSVRWHTQCGAKPCELHRSPSKELRGVTIKGIIAYLKWHMFLVLLLSYHLFYERVLLALEQFVCILIKSTLKARSTNHFTQPHDYLQLSYCKWLAKMLFVTSVTRHPVCIHNWVANTLWDPKLCTLLKPQRAEHRKFLFFLVPWWKTCD